MSSSGESPTDLRNKFLVLPVNGGDAPCSLLVVFIRADGQLASQWMEDLLGAMFSTLQCVIVYMGVYNGLYIPYVLFFRLLANNCVINLSLEVGNTGQVFIHNLLECGAFFISLNSITSEWYVT